MDSLTIVLTDTRLIDGWVAAANANGLSPEAIGQEFLTTQGRSYADLYRVGIITGAAFVSRFTPAEYGAILAAAATNPEVQGLLDQLFDSHNVALDDPRLEPGLALLVSEGLLDAARPAEILFYARPFPQANDTTDPVVDDDTTDLLVDDDIALLPDGGDV